MQQLLDIFLHADEHLAHVVQAHGAWVYALLFAIVFCETGVVIMPFLPGDSLLFAVGALSGQGTLHWWVAGPLILVAAILGDAANYFIGRYAGPKLVAGEKTSRFIQHKHLAAAHGFFVRHGGKAVVLARFVPIVRTCVPFVAGLGRMNYATFTAYNVVGAVAWVGGCMGAGYAFGHLEIVKKNFGLLTIGIVAVSLLPVVIGYLKTRGRSAAPQESEA